MMQLTARLMFAWFASVSGTCHVELDKLPNLNNTKSKTSPKIVLVVFVFVFVLSNRKSKCLLGDPLFDQPDANQIKRRKYWRSIVS